MDEDSFETDQNQMDCCIYDSNRVDSQAQYNVGDGTKADWQKDTSSPEHYTFGAASMASGHQRHHTDAADFLSTDDTSVQVGETISDEHVIAIVFNNTRRNMEAHHI